MEMSTKKLVLFSCIFLLLLSSTVFAAEGVYISGNAGLSLLRDSTLTDTAAGIITTTTDAEFESGLNLGLAVGNDFGNGRFEIAFDYKSHGLDKLKDFSVTGSGNLGDFDGNGDIKTLSAMINGFYDIPLGVPVTPYVGGGVGVARIELDNIVIRGVSIAGSNDTVFAYQLGAGIGYDIIESITVDIGYRYFRTDNPKFRNTKEKYHSHNFILALRVTLN
jgi:opacity protein-like surface antigen